MSSPTAPVRAVDLVPEAFRATDDGDDAPEMDLGTLLAVDSQPIDPATVVKGREAVLKARATRNTQALFRVLFAGLPHTNTEAGPTVTLPAPTTVFPREKPVPAPKELTTWEKFAKEKGIKNKKKDRMVWDDQKQEWLPRWGYKRANDQSQDWAIPVGGNDDPFVDPFEKLAVEKKERVIKNKLNQLKNMTSAAKARGEGKDLKAARLAVAQISTASMGKFDKELKGEPKKKRQVGPRKRRLPAESMGDTARDLSVLRRVLGGTGEGEGAAAGGVLAPSGGAGAGMSGGRGGGAGPSKKKRRGVHAKKGGKTAKGGKKKVK